MISEGEAELNENELNEWCFSHFQSELLKEVNEINSVDASNPFNNIITRSFKYNLDAGESQIGLLESWQSYMNLS